MSDNRSVMQKLTNEFGTSLLSAGISVVASSFLLGVDLTTNVNLFGMNIPMYGAIGLVVGGSDAIAKISHDYVIENIGFMQNIANIEGRLIPPILSGTASYILFYTTISSDVSLINSVLLGAGSTISAEYIMNMIENKNY